MIEEFVAVSIEDATKSILRLHAQYTEQDLIIYRLDYSQYTYYVCNELAKLIPQPELSYVATIEKFRHGYKVKYYDQLICTDKIEQLVKEVTKDACNNNLDPQIIPALYKVDKAVLTVLMLTLLTLLSAAIIMLIFTK